MSLTIYLTVNAVDKVGDHESHIFHTERYNITHNLAEMARHCGLYDYLWDCIETFSVIHGALLDDTAPLAYEIIPHLVIGITALKQHGDYFKKFNPENGWGNYECFVEFCDDLLAGCEEYPTAVVSVCK